MRLSFPLKTNGSVGRRNMMGADRVLDSDVFIIIIIINFI